MEKNAHEQAHDTKGNVKHETRRNDEIVVVVVIILAVVIVVEMVVAQWGLYECPMGTFWMPNGDFIECPMGT